MARIGFVGLGAMGLPMAIALAKAGHAVAGFDLRAQAMAELEAAGGARAASATEAARGADALVLMVVGIDQAEEILFGAPAALDALPEGGCVILMATCAPAAVRALASRVVERGRAVLDAPVSGGVRGAQSGTLTIMAAAPTPVFERMRPLLAAMGDKLFHIGEEPGQGATVKTINQLLCGVHIAVAGEALALAERLGVDPAIALEILGGSAASSWMLKDRGPRMLEDDPPVRSAVDIFVKDLGIVVAAGEAAGMDLPHARTARAVFEALSSDGRGREDDSRTITFFREK